MRFQAPWSCVTGTRQAVTEPSSPYLEHDLVLEKALAATGSGAGEGGFVKAFDFTRVLGHLLLDLTLIWGVTVLMFLPHSI